MASPDQDAPAAAAASDGTPGAAAQSPAPAQMPAKAPVKGGKAKLILGILAIVILTGAAYEGWHWFSFGRFHEETDDAYLEADLITLQARDTGYIADLLVAANAAVTKDQLIARIDPEDYDLALEVAQNKLATAQSTEAQLRAQIVSGRAGIAQAKAAITAANATNDGAQKSFRRAQELKTTSAGTQASLDAAEATAKSAAAQVISAEAALSQADAELHVLEAQLDSAGLDVRAAQTGVKQAQRDLDFTQIRAPFDGILTERQVEVGSFVTTGSRIGTLVPVNDIYIEANFKETQIADIRPGAHVTITVDAWPDTELHGQVDSLTAGTGQVFSLLPASNATGNFTKVVQRVPVRIRIDDKDRSLLPLRPGMSVVVQIDTRTGEDRPLSPAPAATITAPTAPAPTGTAPTSTAPQGDATSAVSADQAAPQNAPQTSAQPATPQPATPQTQPAIRAGG